MIKGTFELTPASNPRTHLLGSIEIVNDETSIREEVGNYNVNLVTMKDGRAQVETRRVENFDRRAPLWDLVRAALPPTSEPCPKCGAAMRPGIAMGQTMVGQPEWPGDTIYTQSPGGPGYIMDCLKCTNCGHSITSVDAWSLMVSGILLRGALAIAEHTLQTCTDRSWETYERVSHVCRLLMISEGFGTADNGTENLTRDVRCALGDTLRKLLTRLKEVRPDITGVPA